jgi:OOP family OmpA-OmpF porin
MKKNLKMIATILGVAALSAASLAAHAQASRPGVYVGGGFGQSEAWDYNCDALATCKKKGTAYRFFGGWQFSRNFGVEVGYMDLGKVTSSNPGFDQSVKVSAGDVMLLGQWLFHENFALYGKVGGYYGKVEADTTQAGASTQVKESKGNGTIAGGIQWYMTPGLALRGEGQRYLKVGGGAIGDSDYTVYSINLLYKF